MQTTVEAVEWIGIDPGTGVSVDYVRITLVMPKADLDEVLGVYDPNSATSPPCADCRPTVRAILDSIPEEE
jgi:hypothetical protein